MSQYKPILSQKSNDHFRKLINLNFKYRDTSEPFDPTPAQADIFASIVSDLPEFRRLVIMGYSQFGKSEIVAMALIWLASPATSSRSVKIPIITPTGEKSQIIMDYILTHIRDQKIFTEGLLNVDAIDRLKVQTRKDKLVWSNNSEIRTLSANVKQREAKSSGLMGFGGDIIIVDEATDIPDVNFAKVLRMLAGHPEKSKMVKIFNPTEKNHAYKSYLDPKYLKIVVDYEDGIEQGRLTRKLIEEFKETMPSQDFQILYECKFPDVSDKYLVSRDQLIAISHEAFPEKDNEIAYAGLDTAWKGKDDIILTIMKGRNFIKQKMLKPEDWTNTTADEIAFEVTSLCYALNVKALCIDATGNGALLYTSIAKENDKSQNRGHKMEVIEVNFAEKPTEKRVESEDPIASKCVNKRAEMFMDFRKAVFDLEIYIPIDFGIIDEITRMEYSFQLGKYKIEPKDRITALIGHSPDKTDSAVLAYHAKILHPIYNSNKNQTIVLKHNLYSRHNYPKRYNDW